MSRGQIEIHFRITVRKFKTEQDRLENNPYDISSSLHSDLLDEGANELIDLLCAEGTPIAFSDAAAYVGVGNGADAFSAAQTDLQGASKTYVAVDSVSRQAGQKARWVATFGAGVGTYAWEEYTVSNTSSGTGVNLMRILSSKGTKGAAESWEITIDEEFT